MCLAPNIQTFLSMYIIPFSKEETPMTHLGTNLCWKSRFLEEYGSWKSKLLFTRSDGVSLNPSDP